MEGLAHSRFNHLVELPDGGGWALYNFATGHLCQLDDAALMRFKRAPSLPADAPDVSSWAKTGFLTSFDELAFARAVATAQARAIALGKAISMLGFTIAITDACNFACPYCFQPKGPTHMAEDTQDALVGLARWRLEHEKHDGLNIVWFGGEPLLAIEAIERLSGLLIEAAEEHNVPYSAIVVTNGYLLDQEMAERLERVRVGHATVTVDGSRETHDAARPLANGGPTYDRIMGNLRELHTSMSISVRCNLHRRNVRELAGLAAQVREMSEHTGTVMRLSPAKVQSAPLNDGRPDMVEMLTRTEFNEATRSMGGRAQAADFDPRSGPCPLVNLNGLFIEANGDVFPRCDAAHTFIGEPLGNVIAWGGMLPGDWDALSRRVIGSYLFPEESTKCLACEMLPCCWGGCPGQRCHQGDAECPTRLADPDAYVLGLVERRLQQ